MKEKLFQDYTFKSGVTVRNRLMIAPMTTFSADENDYVSQEELNYYRERANGVGTILTACAYVSKNGKGLYFVKVITASGVQTSRVEVQ